MLKTPENKVAVASCEYLVACCRNGLPRGETAEDMGDFVQIHLTALRAIKQFWGKAKLVLALEALAREWPPASNEASGGTTDSGATGSKLVVADAASDPRLEPLMVEALEIFNGRWIEPEQPEVLLL